MSTSLSQCADRTASSAKGELPEVAGAIGAVAIGRNEGERLERCLRALCKELTNIVYVDSGSIDGSVGFAKGLGVDVVELDMTKPFTAARARNAGYERLLQLHPELEFIHFFDGDCEVAEGWLEAALKAIRERPEIVAVSGYHEELHADASVYNRVCGLEWRYNIPYGEVERFAGCALVRAVALCEAGGFDPALIAGEEGEFCERLRANGGKILRLEQCMDYHDAAMVRFSQWWRRCVRSGYGIGLGAHRRIRRGEYTALWPVLRVAIWVVMLPTLSAALLFCYGPSSLFLLGLYPLQWLRLQSKNTRSRMAPGDAAYYAAHILLANFPQFLGLLRYGQDVLLTRSGTLIEHK